MESAPEFVTPAPVATPTAAPGRNLQFANSTPFSMGFRLPTSVYYGTRKSTESAVQFTSRPVSFLRLFQMLLLASRLCCHIDRIFNRFQLLHVE